MIVSAGVDVAAGVAVGLPDGVVEPVGCAVGVGEAVSGVMSAVGTSTDGLLVAGGVAGVPRAPVAGEHAAASRTTADRMAIDVSERVANVMAGTSMWAPMSHEHRPRPSRARHRRVTIL